MANNWAIVIGINHYDHHPERQLKYAVPDAQLICDFLCTHAGFARDRILLCLGDEEYKTSPTYPTYPTLLRLLNRDFHPDRIGQVDRFWFFFGGHGVSQNGRDYLLTSDSLIEDIELKIALPIDEVIASLRRHQTADIVLILDNCRQQQGSRKFIVEGTSKQTIESAQSRGITTISSCDYGQSSYELDSLKQGAFTYALVEGLKQYTLPDKLEPYLRRRVAELNQHSHQIPQIIGSASQASQPLLPSAVTPADITVLVDRGTKAELEENFEAAKQLWWQVIEVSQSGDRIREARMAIDRIDRKIARLSGDRSALPSPSIEKKDEDRSAVNPLIQSPPQPKFPSKPSGSAKAPIKPTVQPPKNASERSTSTTPGISSMTTRTVSVARSQPSFPQTQPNQSSAFHSLTRQQFLKWAIPAAVGVASVTLISQFLENLSYSRLEEFLKAGQWEDADQETTSLMQRVANQRAANFNNSVKSFPCDVLSKIDHLWNNSYSNFGFSVQLKIYVEDCGGKRDGVYDEKAWKCLGDRTGWRVNNQWISYSDAIFNTQAPIGHLPSISVGSGGAIFSSLVPRLEKCNK